MSTVSTKDRIQDRMAALNLADGHKHGPDRASTTSSASRSGREVFAPHYRRMKDWCSEGEPVLLEGPAATGKTYSIRQLAKQFNAALYVQQAYRTLAVEDIRGSRGLNSEGTTFEPRDARSLARDLNGWFFIDELNVADPAIICLLNNLLDGSGEVTIPETGDVVKRSDKWRFFGAYNAGCVATGQLSEALVSRCVVIECDHFPPDIEEELILGSCSSIGQNARRVRGASISSTCASGPVASWPCSGESPVIRLRHFARLFYRKSEIASPLNQFGKACCARLRF